MFLGLAFNTVLSFGNQAWIPTFFVRTFGWSAAEAGITNGIIICCTAPLVGDPHLAMALVGLNFMISMLCPGPQNAALQIITPNEMRGQMTALFLFIFNFVGYGLGPSFVALLTDQFFGEANLRYSLSIGSAIMGPLAAATIWWGLKPYAESVRRARQFV